MPHDASSNTFPSPLSLMGKITKFAFLLCDCRSLTDRSARFIFLGLISRDMVIRTTVGASAYVPQTN